MASLGRAIQVLDRPGVVELSIREFLRYSADDAPADKQLEVLSIAGLSPTIAQLPKGLDTQLGATGWPLGTAEVMQLKLAGALLAKPSVLILNQLYDLVNPQVLKRSLDYLQRDSTSTVLCFSNRDDVDGYDSFLFLNRDQQTSYPTYAQMMQTEGREVLGEPSLNTDTDSEGVRS